MIILVQEKQKYHIRKDVLEKGKKYEVKVAALISLWCTNSQIDDVKLLFNPDGFESWDDLVLSITDAESGNSTLHLIQIKLRENGHISANMLMGNSGDLSLKKCLRDFIKVKNKKIIEKNIGQVSAIDCILFTNGGVPPLPVMVEKSHRFCERGYQVVLSDVCDQVVSDVCDQVVSDVCDQVVSDVCDQVVSDVCGQVVSDVCDQVVLSDVCDQVVLSDVSDQVALSNVCDQVVLSDVCDQVVLSDVCNQVVSSNVCDQVVLSNQGDIGADFYIFPKQPNLITIEEHITKEITKLLPQNTPHDTLAAFKTTYLKYIEDWAQGTSGFHYVLTREIIGNIIFDIFGEIFSQKVKGEGNLPEDEILTEILMQPQMIIIEKNQRTERAVSNFLKRQLLINFGDLFEMNSFQDSISKTVYGEIYTTYKDVIQSVGYTEMKTYGDLYKILWKNRKVPLVLYLDEIEVFRSLNQLLGVFKSDLRVIILTENKMLLETDQLRTIRSLGDLPKKFINAVIGKKRLTFQGKLSGYLIALIKYKLASKFTISNVIDILDQGLNIGGNFAKLPKHYIVSRIPKILINENVFYNTNDKLLVYYQFLPTMSSNLLFQENTTLIELKRFDDFKQSASKRITAKPTHSLRKVGSQYEWLSSHGSTKILQTFQKEETDQLVDFFSNKLSDFMLVSAPPGMGKSTFLRYLARHTPSNTWVLLIDIKRQLSNITFNFQKPKECLRKINQILLNGNTLTKELDNEVFEVMLQKKRILILMDGFDEIVPMYTEDTLKLIKLLKSRGYKIWLTTRPTAKKYLTEELNVLGTTILPLTTEEQMQLLLKYFSLEARTFVGRLLKYAHQIMPEFVSNPLQINMLAEFTLSHCTGETLELKDINILELYESVVEDRLNKAEKHFGDIFKCVQGMVENYYMYKGLVEVFPGETFTEEVEELKKLEGMISVFDNDYFSHRTFMEYFAAKWMFTNFSSKKHVCKRLYHYIFDNNLLFMRRLFDLMMAKGHPLHTAIINGHEKSINDLLEPTSKCDSDRLNRTPFHLLAIYTDRFIMPEIKDNVFTLDVKNCFYIKSSIPVTTINKIITSHDYIPNEPDLILDFTPIEYSCHVHSMTFLNAFIVYSESTQVATICQRRNVLKYYLFFCAKYKFDHITLNLIRHGGSTVQKLLNSLSDTKGNNLFHLAAQYSSSNFIRLCPKLAAIKKKNNFGFKPYDIALANSDYFTCDILKDKGATKTTKKLEEIFRHSLADKNWEKTVYMLELNYKPRTERILGEPILHYLIRYNQFQGVKLLVKSVPILTQHVDEFGSSALHLACKCSPILAKLLIQHGARNWNLQNKEGITPLHYACKSGDVALVDTLLKFGADQHISDENGNKAIHYAAQQSCSQIIQRLIDRDAEVINDLNKHLQTPLLLAVKYNQLENVEVLLGANADPKIPDKYYQSPIRLAKLKNHEEIEELLRLNGCCDDMTVSRRVSDFSLNYNSSAYEGNFNQTTYLSRL